MKNNINESKAISIATVRHLRPRKSVIKQSERFYWYKEQLFLTLFHFGKKLP